MTIGTLSRPKAKRRWIVDPDSRLIEVFVLAEGTYRQHARGVGAEKVGSKLLAGLTVSFDQLEE